MSKTIIVGGFGPGISKAVAEKFGAEGFSVAIVGRNAERLAAGVAALEGKGVKAAAFQCDLGDANAVKAMVADVRKKFGPITVVQWTAYVGAAGDLMTADAAAIHAVMDVAVTGLVTAVQAAHADLKSEKGAVLVTNGGFSLPDPQVDAMAVQWNVMGLAVASAAKSKVVGLLSQKLNADGIYVGQVVVMGSVKGTAFDTGNANLEGSTIANKFWELYTSRTTVTANVS